MYVKAVSFEVARDGELWHAAFCFIKLFLIGYPLAVNFR